MKKWSVIGLIILTSVNMVYVSSCDSKTNDSEVTEPASTDSLTQRESTNRISNKSNPRHDEDDSHGSKLLSSQNVDMSMEKLEEESPKDPKRSKPVRSGLYKPSQLALTMRDMAKDMEFLRQKADEGTLTVEEVNALMQAHQAMSTDTPTKPEDIKPSFLGFSEAYLIQLDDLRATIAQQSSREERLDAFNAAIATCVACHQDHCPGPIPRIQKIKVQP